MAVPSVKISPRLSSLPIERNSKFPACSCNLFSPAKFLTLLSSSFSRSVTSKYDGSKRAQKRLPRANIGAGRTNNDAIVERSPPEIHSNSDVVEEKGERGKLGPTETSADWSRLHFTDWTPGDGREEKGCVGGTFIPCRFHDVSRWKEGIDCTYNGSAGMGTICWSQRWVYQLS